MVLMESGAREVKGGGLLGLVLQGGRRAALALLDQLYPPACAACGVPIAEGVGLCAKCFAGLQSITAPLCPVLGLPFEVALGPDAFSAEALADPPPFARARAAVRYGEVAQSLVTRLKYGDRTELAQFCARLMASAGHEFWAARPLLVPVPLHPSRLRFRRYNQSYLLAKALGRELGLDVDPFLVRRHKKTRSQIGLSGDGRARNVQGAFSAHPDALVRIRGRRVVLIDDVYTTGATVKAVARTLLRNGANEVDVLTFARVVSGEEVPI
ncbi:MAG: ComF family protein [Devosia sp.]